MKTLINNEKSLSITKNLLATLSPTEIEERIEFYEKDLFGANSILEIAEGPYMVCPITGVLIDNAGNTIAVLMESRNEEGNGQLLAASWTMLQALKAWQNYLMINGALSEFEKQLADQTAAAIEKAEQPL